MGKEDLDAIFNPSIRLMHSLDISEIDNCNVTFAKGDDKDSNEEDEDNFQLQMHQNNSPFNGKKKEIIYMLFIQVELCNSSLDKWLAMDMQTLKNHQDCPFGHRSKPLVLNIFSQLSSAIEYVHGKGLMHRDLKPANIFFNRDKQVKLGDFGLVTFKIGAPSDISKDVIHQMSNYDSLYTRDVGTILYMAPEVLEGRVYSQKVDIYSLGMIFYEILSFFDTFAERIGCLRDVRNRAIFTEKFKIEHPKELKLIKSMLLQNPRKRYSASVVHKHVQEIQGVFKEG